MRWKTGEVKELIELAIQAESFTTLPEVKVQEIGGDHDTEGIQVVWGDGEALWVCGFHCTATNFDPGQSPEDMEIEMVEVTDGKDSRGGLNSHHPDLCKGYGVICGALKRAGFDTCPCMKDYF